jgi:hypothetical protein
LGLQVGKINLRLAKFTLPVGDFGLRLAKFYLPYGKSGLTGGKRRDLVW